MDRKSAFKKLKKLAQEQHSILQALAQDETPLAAGNTGATQVNRAALESAVSAKLEELLPGAGAAVRSLQLAELESAKPAVFLKYKSSPNDKALKDAVTQAAKSVLKRDVVLQAIGEF